MKGTALTVKIIRFLSFLSALILLLTACSFADGVGTETSADSGAETEKAPPLVADLPTSYAPLSAKGIQFANGMIYFECGRRGRGFFKYDPATNEVSDVCSDPFCHHMGSKNDSCNIWNYRIKFRAFSDVVVYHALGRIDGVYDVRLYSYDPIKMKNIMIDDDASTSSTSRIGDRYYYCDNIIVKEENGEKVTYSNLKQVDLFTGEEKIFGDLVKGSTPEYVIVGAIDGNIYANHSTEGGLYICPEDDPGSFRMLRSSSIGYVFVGENYLFFKSTDPEDGKEYYYHTDIMGNEIAKRELIGGMQWGSIYDGRYLYYIPSETVNFECGDGSTQPIHWREIYKLDMQTGERTVVFTFNGEYETMGLVKGDSLFIVHDNKLFTNQIGEYNFERDAADPSNPTVYGKGVTFTSGLIVIDLENGDITRITAEYERINGSTELVCDTEKIEMDLEGEK